MTEFATGALAALAALFGAVLGWLAGRGRERREMRRAAYVEWLRAARLVVTWPIDEPPPQSGARVPHPKMLFRLVDAVAEVELLGSDRVVAGARAYLAKVQETGRSLAEQGAVYNDIIKAIDEGLEPDRQSVQDLMRKDLRSRR